MELHERVGERPARQPRILRARLIECVDQACEAETLDAPVEHGIGGRGVEFVRGVEDDLQCEDALVSCVPVLEYHSLDLTRAHKEVIARFGEAEVGVFDAGSEGKRIAAVASPVEGVPSVTAIESDDVPAGACANRVISCATADEAVAARVEDDVVTRPARE